MPESSVFSHAKIILFLVSLLFGALAIRSIPTHYLKFNYSSLFAFYIFRSLAGTKNVTGAYLIIMLVSRCLLAKHLQAKRLYYSKLCLENSENYLSKAIITHVVMKHMQKHRVGTALLIISLV